MLKVLDFKFDIIALSETKLKKNTKSVKRINLNEYFYEDTPTEAEKGGTILYISKSYDYKRREDLEIYESKSIESTFVELILPKKKNKIIGCIYKHHNITEKQFIDSLIPVIQKIRRENKKCFLAGDFNINLLNINSNHDSNLFFEETTGNGFMPLITLPTRITARSKTLIDNIFYNEFSDEIVS